MKRALSTAGFASTAAGLALLLTPLEAPASVPVVPALGVVGAAGLAVGALVTLARTGASTSSSLADASRGDVAVPGDRFDDELAALSVGGDGDDAVRERVREAAVDVLAGTAGVPRSVARERIEAGNWPADDRAVAFFEERPPTRRERVRTVLTGEPTAARRARVAISVVAERRREP